MNRDRGSIVCAGALMLAVLGGCDAGSGAGSDASVMMANPASEYCVTKGGTLEIVKDKVGNEQGMCHLPDGTVVEEWKLFRRDHAQKP